MPTIPTYADTQQTVRADPLPGNRFQANAPAEAFNAGASAQGVENAALGTEHVVADVAKEARDRADQIAHLQAATDLSKAMTSIQLNVANMKGKDAFAAPDYAEKSWQDAQSKIRGNLVGQNQQLAFDRTSASLFQDLNRSVQMHVNEQSVAFEDQTTQSGINQARTAAVVNSGDNEIIESNVDLQRKLVQAWAKRKGIPETDPDGKPNSIFQDRMTQEVSATHKDVIQSKINAGLDEDAQKYFDTHKAEMAGGDVEHTQSALEGVEVIRQGRDIWDKVSGTPSLKFSDGSFNVEKMRAQVQTELDGAGISDRRQEQVLKFVEQRGREANFDRNKSLQEHDRSFMNELVQAKQGGTSMEDAMKLAGKYGTDSYDQAIKTDAIQKMYAPPSESDPAVHLAMWTRATEGSVTQRELGVAMQNGKLNAKDWLSLSQLLYKTNTEGTDPLSKSAWDRVGALATQSLGSGDKESYKRFMYDMHVSAQGKSPEEIIKMATEKLKDDPNTGWWGETGPLHSKQFEGDVKNLDQQNLAWGDVYQNVGRKETGLIGQAAMMQTGKPNYNMSDVEAFAAQFGGMDKIKQGTPVNNAIQYLNKNNLPATAANINWQLKRQSTAGTGQ